MGLYDTRCMITGISLYTADAVMVGLDRDGDGHRPVTLGVAGAYNGYGVLEDVVEDRNTELILAWCLDRARDGDMTFHPDYKTRLGAPPRDIASVLAYFERNFCDSSDEWPALALHGRPIVHGMVSKLVWDAVAGARASDAGTVEAELEDLFRDVFGDSPVAAAIYGSALPEVAGHVRDMHAVTAFLRAHGIAWSTPDLDVHGMVYLDEEVEAFVTEARARFAGVPVLLDALDRHVEEQRRFADD